MNRLHAQWQRLFLAPGLQPRDDQAPPLADAQGRTRVLLLELARPADWQALSAVWQAVQQELGLPAPAIAISGHEGYQLWFPLAAPIAAAQGLDFLRALCRRYLPDTPAPRLHLQAGNACDSGRAGPGPTVDLPPRPQTGPERWSAFVSPDLAPVFTDSPWLDMAPGPDAQADVLATVLPVPGGALEEALSRLSPATAAAPLPATQTSGESPHPAAAAREAAIAFLTQVMHDGSAPLAQRIEAARALLGNGR